MLYKKRIFLLFFISISCLGMDRPVIQLKQTKLAQKRLDSGLIQAVKKGNKNQVKSWLSNGANPLALDEENGKTAFQIANELANDEIINLFYVYLHPLKQLPAEIGAMVRKYVEDDAVRARTIKEAINNSKAYLDKNPEFVGHLIKKKFGQVALDQELFRATTYYDNEYTKALIKIGANVNTVSPTHHMTPISRAMSYNPNSDLLKALIDAGANLNVQGDDGTPLMKATTYYISDHGLKLIKLFLAAGADPAIKGNIFGSPYMSAREYAQNQLNHRNVKNDPQKIKILNEMIKILEDAEALQEAVKEHKPEFKPKV